MLTSSCGIVALSAAGFLQWIGHLLVVGIVLAMVAYGTQNGLFRAVVAGMHALVSLVVALAFADTLGIRLVSWELPAQYAFAAAFGILLLGTAAVIRIVVGSLVPADVVRFAPMIDTIGGGLFGALAGIIVAGTALITCSVAPVPEALRIDGSKLRYDLGSTMLRTYARCVAPNEDRRKILLDGEPTNGTELLQPPPGDPTEQHDQDKRPERTKDSAKRGNVEGETPPTPSAVSHWSEPFADLDGDKAYDDGEPFLDTDGDNAFTYRLALNDKPGNTEENEAGNGKRDIGLLECYRMHAWGRHVISVVAPDEILPSGADSEVALTEMLDKQLVQLLKEGKVAEAEALAKRAVDESKRDKGPDHPDTAACLKKLAELYTFCGNYDQAETSLKRALTIDEKTLGPDHPETAKSLNNLAWLCYVQGKYNVAEPLFKRAIVIREKSLGPEHPDTAQSLNDLAVLEGAQGKYDEAESLFKQALGIYEKSRHPRTATTLYNLADLYSTRGKYADAEPCFKRAIAIFEKTLGSDHPKTRIARDHLAAMQVERATREVGQ